MEHYDQKDHLMKGGDQEDCWMRGNNWKNHGKDNGIDGMTRCDAGEKWNWQHCIHLKYFMNH
jgi:hypothetical protein